MDINVLLLAALVVVGAYRLHASRKDKPLFAQWAFLIAGLMSAPASQLMPGGKLLTLGFGAACLLVSCVLFALRPKSEP